MNSGVVGWESIEGQVTESQLQISHYGHRPRKTLESEGAHDDEPRPTTEGGRGSPRAERVTAKLPEAEMVSK